MRIGLFTDAYVPQIGGVSTSTYLLKEELSRRGHQVCVITTTDPEAYQEAHCIRVPSLPFVSSKRIALNYEPLLRRRMEGLKLDIIHTQTEFGVGVFGRNFARKEGLIHIHTYHTIYEDWLHNQFKVSPDSLRGKIISDYVRLHSRVFCNVADRILVPTEKTAHILEGYEIDCPMEVCPTGIALRDFREARKEADSGERQRKLRQELGIGLQQQVLLYLGRISQEKQIQQLFHYLAPQLRRRPELCFLLVGDGPYLQELQRLGYTLGIDGQLRFAGSVPMHEVPQYYALADFFLSASQSETQGLTYIEALAAGLPVLAREDPCLDGVLSPGENGLLFRDEASFVSGLEQFLSLGLAEYQDWSRRAGQSAERFSVEAFASHVEAIYEEQLAAGKRPRRGRTEGDGGAQ